MKEYGIKSINLIAYMKTKGMNLLRIEKEDSGQVVHYFEHTPEFSFYLNEYKQDKNLQSFITNLSNTRYDIKQLVK